MEAKAENIYDRLFEVEVERLLHNGVGIGYADHAGNNYRFSFRGGWPGQTLCVKPTKIRRKKVEAKILNKIKSSPDETTVPFQPSPGAPLLGVSYDKQVQWKESWFLEMLRDKLGNIDPIYHGIVSSPVKYHYRNKMEYSFGDLGSDGPGFYLGFKAPGQWQEVVNLEQDSGLFDQTFENKLPAIREYLRNTNLPAWNAKADSGFFETLLVRKSYAEDKFVVQLRTAPTNTSEFQPEAFYTFLADNYGNKLAGFSHETIHKQEGENTTYQRIFLKGQDFVTEKINDLSFKIGMESFFQTNPASAEIIYSAICEEVAQCVTESDKAWMDLFCGTGTIAQILAKSFPTKQIIGVDIVGRAILDARMNMELNGLNNLNFYESDVGKFLLKFPEYIGKIEGVVIDPPRSGISAKSLRKVARLKPKKIIYVSCSPDRMIADFDQLGQMGYFPKSCRLFDQFPQTRHLEALSVFETK